MCDDLNNTVICIDYGGKSVTNIICKVFWNRVDFGNTEPISAGRWTDSIALTLSRGY